MGAVLFIVALLWALERAGEPDCARGPLIDHQAKWCRDHGKPREHRPGE